MTKCFLLCFIKVQNGLINVVFSYTKFILTRQKEGAGLGLSIVKAYIDIMQGKIWLESEPGKGSCFYFSVPIESLAVMS